MMARGQMPDVPPPVPLPVPVLPSDPPERDEPPEPDWSDDELPPVVNSTEDDEDVAHLTGLQFWEDTDGQLRVTLHDQGRMIELKVPPEDAGTAPGFYDFDMRRIADPYD